MKVRRKYLKKIPDLKEFRDLGENLSRSYLKIQELYPNKMDVSFELTNGMCFYSKHGQICGAFNGDLFGDGGEMAMESLALDLQLIAQE